VRVVVKIDIRVASAGEEVVVASKLGIVDSLEAIANIKSDVFSHAEGNASAKLIGETPVVIIKQIVASSSGVLCIDINA
jgi:hypothetical protein